MAEMADEHQHDIELNFMQVRHETPSAWLLLFEITSDLENVERWLPKSLCRIDREGRTIQVPEWLAIQDEIEGYEVGVGHD